MIRLDKIISINALSRESYRYELHRILKEVLEKDKAFKILDEDKK